MELPLRWLRIHSLPGSKRYATNELEYQALLARHNEVASEVLGASGLCHIFLRFHDDKSAERLKREYSGIPLSQAPELRYAEPDDLDIDFGFLEAEITWAPRQYDQLLRDVADD